VLVFDYRGFGDSEGEPGIILPMRQAQDLRNAIPYLETRPEVDPDRIGMFGSGGTGGANRYMSRRWISGLVAWLALTPWPAAGTGCSARAGNMSGLSF